MPIPDMTAQGLLPEGIHSGTFEELSGRFGQPIWMETGDRSALSTRRQELTANLESYLIKLRRAGFAQAVIVNGSYVTGEAEPNDIDLLILYSDDFDLATPMTPIERNLISNRWTEPNWGLHVFAATEGSVTYAKMVAQWSQVRAHPGQAKGMVRIPL